MMKRNPLNATLLAFFLLFGLLACAEPTPATTNTATTEAIVAAVCTRHSTSTAVEMWWKCEKRVRKTRPSGLGRREGIGFRLRRLPRRDDDDAEEGAEP